MPERQTARLTMLMKVMMISAEWWHSWAAIAGVTENPIIYTRNGRRLISQRVYSLVPFKYVKKMQVFLVCKGIDL